MINKIPQFRIFCEKKYDFPILTLVFLEKALLLPTLILKLLSKTVTKLNHFIQIKQI